MHEANFKSALCLEYLNALTSPLLPEQMRNIKALDSRASWSRLRHSQTMQSSEEIKL